MEVGALPETTPSFHERFVQLFELSYQRLFRLMNRLSGEQDLAADLVQEAFVRLYRRGRLPDTPEAWLVTVAMNLLRNEKSTRSRRHRLLTPTRGTYSLADPPPSPEQTAAGHDSRERVRLALERLPERERSMLVLRADGLRYREIAAALDLNVSSVGVLLARARRSFLELYGENADAS